MPSGLDNLGITNAAMAGVSAMVSRGPLTNITATAYTIGAKDNGKYLRFTAAGAVTATINQDSAGGAMPMGAELTVEAGGAGGTTITAGTGVTFHGVTGVSAQYAVKRVRKVSANTYTLY